MQFQRLGNMSYMKKDEDADQVMIKLDRTSVFQDGMHTPPGAAETKTHHLSLMLTD